MSRKQKWLIALACVLTGLVWYIFSLPNPLFADRYSTLLLDRQGNLLTASIAADGQWRFPEGADVPEKYAAAVVLFEDKRFYNHHGVDLLALGRATRQNFTAHRVVSGASTITMQVVRLLRKNPPRTTWQKLVEILLATRLEWRYSKEEIMALYAAHAPFGGNVVGLEAACWRYFGRQTRDLTWAEAATLAVLPNHPALIHPGRNRELLLQKRNRLLHRLYRAGAMDSMTWVLNTAEHIPDEPTPIPRLARHLLDRAVREGKSQQRVTTTLDADLQQLIEQKAEDYRQRLLGNQVHNAAVLVADVNSGEVRAYVGNVQAGKEHQEQVDIIQASRSTGSILKPFLFAAMLEEGKLLPGTLVPDVPMFLHGFSPHNFSRRFDGAVPAGQALIRSLNVPAVNELREYRYEKFHSLLRSLGMTTLGSAPERYGLTLVLGGAEGTLWDITGMYASMARTLNYYRAGAQPYWSGSIHPLTYVVRKDTADLREKSALLSAASLWQTFEVLRELNRPGEETGWRHFSSSKMVAWKTGTSFGFRDGWAVGVDPQHVVGVWTGNADGEGRPGLTGTDMAAPLMLDIFSALPGRSWFARPADALVRMSVCVRSGQRATANCPDVEEQEVGFAALQSKPCSHHQRIFLSNDSRHRVHRDCATDLREVSWFVLPPLQEYYYRQTHPDYQSVPPYRKDCEDPQVIQALEVVYPREQSSIVVPRNLDGSLSSMLAEAAHRNPAAIVFWHLDGDYLGQTRGTHQWQLKPAAGDHVLTLVDDQGQTVQRHFRVPALR